MDVLDHLTEEHRKVERLLDQLADSDEGAEREELISELESSLGTHMEVEERFVYPIVTDVLGAEDKHEGVNEHDLARDGLVKLRELQDEPGFGAAVDMLKAGIGHHVEEEERDMFPKLRQDATDRIAASIRRVCTLPPSVGWIGTPLNVVVPVTLRNGFHTHTAFWPMSPRMSSLLFS